MEFHRGLEDQDESHPEMNFISGSSRLYHVNRYKELTVDRDEFHPAVSHLVSHVRGESIIDFVRQLRHSDASGWVGQDL